MPNKPLQPTPAPLNREHYKNVNAFLVFLDQYDHLLTLIFLRSDALRSPRNTRLTLCRNWNFS